MLSISLVLGAIIVAALAFDYINGFHDTANAVATVVSTRVLTPTQAIGMAAVLNFFGALIATRVAHTIATGILDGSPADVVVLGAIFGAIVWNLVTWKYGIPSSSSHALIGGLVGAAASQYGFSVVKWDGLREKVLIPLVGSPLFGFAIGWLLMGLIALLFRQAHPARVGNVFRRLQVVSSAFMALSHGQNDAQKSMGIITMALLTTGHIKAAHVPVWVMLACAAAMALGTSAGGWRIMKTMGHKIIRLEPVHGFAAETSGASVIIAASLMGMPVSTTQVIAGSIFGVGASKRLSAVRWNIAQSMLVAWVVTLPAAGLIAAAATYLLAGLAPAAPMAR